jgi:hypothetical protein
MIVAITFVGGAPEEIIPLGLLHRMAPVELQIYNNCLADAGAADVIKSTSGVRRDVR